MKTSTHSNAHTTHTHSTLCHTHSTLTHTCKWCPVRSRLAELVYIPQRSCLNGWQLAAFALVAVVVVVVSRAAVAVVGSRVLVVVVPIAVVLLSYEHLNMILMSMVSTLYLRQKPSRLSWQETGTERERDREIKREREGAHTEKPTKGSLFACKEDESVRGRSTFL